jgi:hypothetical protein
MGTSEGIAGEAGASLPVKVGSDRQIFLSAGETDVPQIDGKVDE